MMQAHRFAFLLPTTSQKTFSVVMINKTQIAKGSLTMKNNSDVTKLGTNDRDSSTDKWITHKMKAVQNTPSIPLP